MLLQEEDTVCVKMRAVQIVAERLKGVLLGAVTLPTGLGKTAGFARVPQNLESAGILCWHFPGLENPGKKALVLESSGNLINSTRRSKCQLSNLFTCMQIVANSRYQPS